MEFWMSYLPIVIYFLLIVLLIVLIILGIKSINILSKAEKIIDSVNEKIEAINPIFHMIDFATDRIASLSDTFVDVITGFLGKLFTRKEKEKVTEDEEK